MLNQHLRYSMRSTTLLASSKVMVHNCQERKCQLNESPWVLCTERGSKESMWGIGNEPAWLRGRLADRGASNSTIMLLLSILFFASGDCCCLDSVGSSASTSTLSSPLISHKSAQRAQLAQASPRATQNFVPADNQSHNTKKNVLFL